MIEKAIIEALASLGTGNAPRFQWSADALSLKDAIDGLAVNRMRLPQACDESESDAVLALAIGLHYTKVNTARHELPLKAMRRVATLSMHFGAMLAEVAHIHDRKVAALLVHILAGQDVTNEKPSLQNLLVAASCAAKLHPGRMPAIEDVCQGMLIPAGSNLQVLAMVGAVMDSVQTAETTRDFAAIAECIFPDVGEECADEALEEGEQGDSENMDGPSASTSPSSAVECQGQPSDADSANTSKEPGLEHSTEQNAGGGSEDQKSKEASAGAGQEELHSPLQEEPSKGKTCNDVDANDSHLCEVLCLDELDGHATVVPTQTANMEEQGGGSVPGGNGDASTHRGKSRDTPEIFAKNQNLVCEILRLLQSMDKRHTSLERQGRRISTKHVWRLKKLGDSRIFKQTTKVEGSQIAVEILVDGSGSMGSDLKVACEVSLSFCDALQRMPKSTSAVSIFSGDDGVSTVVKEHGQNVQKVQSKLSLVSAGGGTPTGAAMLNRLLPLLAQRQERKLMIVITDGLARNVNSAQAAVKYANHQGVQVIGIGIGTQGRAVKSFIPDAFNINSLEELGGALRNLMRNQVLA